MRYPGGKNAGGAYQRIINEIPPHRVFVEPFAGSAAVYRNKRAAASSVLIDADPAAPKITIRPGTDTYLTMSAADYLSENFAELNRPDVFIYCDPPYLPSTRVKTDLYRCEMTTSMHIELLNLLTCFTVSMIAISGYPAGMYDLELLGWRTIEWQQMTRGGTFRTEKLWMNYGKPAELHDYRYLGDTFGERQRIRRKRSRIVGKLSGIPAQERAAILEELTKSI